jgi:hypothetical protein
VAEGCDRNERISGVILELKEKAGTNRDITELPSVNELVPTYWGLYQHEKYGKVAMDKELAKVRRQMEKTHPLLKFYKLAHDEVAANGNTIKRFYITILEGIKEVRIVNDRLDRETDALNRIKTGNEDANDVKAVRAERRKYLTYLRNKRKIDSS